MATREVSPKLAIGLLPSAQRLCRRGQAGIEAEGVKKPVRGQRQQVATIGFHGLFEYSIFQPNLRHRERPDLPCALLQAQQALFPVGVVSQGGTRSAAGYRARKEHSTCHSRGCRYKLPSCYASVRSHKELLHCYACGSSPLGGCPL